MKSILACVIMFLTLLTVTNSASAQKEEDQLFIFDADFKATDIKKAVYLLRLKKIDDTTYQWDTYNFFGPLIRSETTRDKEGDIPHGPVYFYKPRRGTIDSVHNYQNGFADGKWYYYNDTGRAVIGKVYAAGKLIRTIDYLYEDSVEKSKPDTVDHSQEIESEFPGGMPGWIRFLNKNFRYPERALNANIQGQVGVQFIVDTSGKVQDLRIYRSVEFSLDEEALRILRNSPDWKTAMQNGRKVKSYKRQPIVFRTE